MSTKFLLNIKWHHVGFSWVVLSSKQMKYDIKENNHPAWLNKGPQYKTANILGLNSLITIIKLGGGWIMKLSKSCSKKSKL